MLTAVRKKISLFVKDFLIVTFFYIFLPLSSFHSQAQDEVQFEFFDFEKMEENELPDYDINKILKISWEQSFDVKKSLKEIAISQLHKKQLFSLLLPELDISDLTSLVKADLFIVLKHLFGFVFPNRWYDWKAGKYTQNSKKELYKALIADNTNLIQIIYFEIQRQITNLKIYNYYKQLLVFIVNELKFQIKNNLRLISDHDMGIIESLINKLDYYISKKDELEEYYPLLVSIAGLPNTEENAFLSLKTIRPEGLDGKKKLEMFPLFPNSLDASNEIEALNQYVKAIKANKKGFYFKVIDPSERGNLGLSLYFNYQIISEKINLLKIDIDRAKTHIFSKLGKLLNAYNESINMNKAKLRAKWNLTPCFKELETMIIDPSIAFEVNKVIRLLDFMMENDLALSDTYYAYRSSESTIERMVWGGEIFNELKDYVIKVLKNKKYN